MYTCIQKSYKNKKKFLLEKESLLEQCQASLIAIVKTEFFFYLDFTCRHQDDCVKNCLRLELEKMRLHVALIAALACKVCESSKKPTLGMARAEFWGSIPEKAIWSTEKVVESGVCRISLDCSRFLSRDSLRVVVDNNLVLDELLGRDDASATTSRTILQDVNSSPLLQETFFVNFGLLRRIPDVGDRHDASTSSARSRSARSGLLVAGKSLREVFVFEVALHVLIHRHCASWGHKKDVAQINILATW